MALQPQDHGMGIFRHRATNRPTASMAAEVKAATPGRQRGRVGGLPQKQPVSLAPSAPVPTPSLPSPPAPISAPSQRIGYFGRGGGGIVTLPSNPQMDAIDNPDHGASTFNGDGIRVETRPFLQSKAVNDASVAPDGGPVFPALEDVQISSTPT